MLVPCDFRNMLAHTVTSEVSRLGFNTLHPEILNEEVYSDCPALGME